MKQLLTLLSLVLIAGSSLAQKKTTPKNDPLADLDTAFQRVLKDRKAVGFAVAVVSKDGILYSKGFGYRNLESKQPVTTNTLFAIGSCSKAFTSSLMGMLQSEGKVDFDKPVRNYMPELSFFNDDLNNNVTIRDMMTHRTGLPRHDYSWYIFNSSSRDSLLQRIKYQEPTTKLRQSWQYNNFMFLAQGMIAEKFYKQSWEESVKEKIFAPLNMKHSNLTIKDWKAQPDIAAGYRVQGDSLIKKMDYYNINAMGPAGSINSNVTDMANWVQTWINGGKFNGKQVLPASYVKDAMSSQMVISPGFPDKEIPDAHLANYGFGWFISSYRGHYCVEHGGNIDGFSASTSFFPSDSIGIIVLTNQNGSAVTDIVRNMIADRLFGLKKVNWNGRVNEAEAKAKKAGKEAETTATDGQKKGTTLSHPIVDYEGLFNHPGYGTIDVELHNDSLMMLTPHGAAWLRHYHYDVFELIGIDDDGTIDTASKDNTKLQFHMSPAGEINAVSIGLQPGLDDIRFERKPKEQKINASELKKYVGDYELAPGVLAKFYTKEEKTLYAFIEGQPEYELVSTGKNKFAIKVLSGYNVEFEENEKGEIISASFVQPNGTFKAKRK